jgi:enoyl-CoA hydratase
MAMDYRHLQVQEHAGIVTARMHRPAERNALNRRLIAELTDFARAQRSRTDIRAVILAGAMQGFSAGADLSDPVLSRGTQRPTLLEARQAVLAGPDMCRAWEEIEAITIAAIEGYCIGGACALAL